MKLDCSVSFSAAKKRILLNLKTYPVEGYANEGGEECETSKRH